jgi:hypothetical protein
VTSSGKVPALLLLNGVVIAAHTLMAKKAYEAGVTPIVYAFASAAGAAAFLFAFRLAQKHGAGLKRPRWSMASSPGSSPWRCRRL